VSVLPSRYLILSPLPISPINDSMFSQYYALATGTILFYDYLLTLADEVCGFYRKSFSSFIETALFIDQIHVVWKEDVECARHLKWMMSSADTSGSILALRCCGSRLFVLKSFPHLTEGCRIGTFR
jgi:hypothetical protein